MHITFFLTTSYVHNVSLVMIYVTPAFPKKIKCKPICIPGSSFMHIVTYKKKKDYHVRKRKIIRDLRFIQETKAPNITDSRLGVAYA
jgi:hypothetical protein